MLHPQAQTLLRLIAERGLPAMDELPPVESRAAYLQRRHYLQPEPPEVAEVRAMDAGAIPLRLYRPLGSQASDVLPVLVYYHGGGWVIGDLDSHDTLCRQLCNASGCAIVSVHYRLAPEARFPAAVDDALAAARWVHANAARLNLDPQRVGVGGDSAGGNLAAVTAIAARDEGGLPLKFQLLIYPSVDQRRVHPSHTENGGGYLLTKSTIAYFLGHYLSDKASELDLRASPLLHSDLGRLPPAVVLVAGFDPLRDEGVEYAEKLLAAGTRCSLVTFAQQIHGFITMGRVLDDANVAMRMCAAEIRATLNA